MSLAAQQKQKRKIFYTVSYTQYMWTFLTSKLM